MDGPVGKGALQDLTRNKPSLEGLASQDGTSWGKQACEPSCTNTASPGRNHGKLPPPAPIGRSPSGFCTVHRWAYQAPSSGGTGLQRVCTACPCWNCLQVPTSQIPGFLLALGAPVSDFYTLLLALFRTKSAFLQCLNPVVEKGE